MKLNIDIVFETLTELPVWSVDIHPNEPLIAISNGFEKIEIYNYETKSKLTTISALCKGNYDHQLKFISREDWLLVGSDDGCVRVYNIRSFDLVKEIQVSSEYPISSMNIHSDEPFLFTSCSSNIQIWNWKKDWKCEKQFVNIRTVRQMKLNPSDLDMFASGSEDHMIRIWSLSHHQSIATLEGDSWTQSLDFSPSDEPHLISGWLGGTVRIWNYRTFQLVNLIKLDGISGIIQTIRFHQHLPIFIVQTCSKTDHHVLIYNAKTLEKLDRICERSRSMEILRYSNIFVLGCENGVRIFDITENIDKQLISAKDLEIQSLKEQNEKLKTELNELKCLHLK